MVDCYCELKLLLPNVRELLCLKNEEYQNSDVFSYGATAHIVCHSHAILQEMFQSPNRFKWRCYKASCTPNLSPCDLFYEVTSKLKFLNIVFQPLKNLRRQSVKKKSAEFHIICRRMIENLRRNPYVYCLSWSSII